MSESIEEVRARVDRLKTPHRVKIDVSGAVDIVGIAAIYANSLADITFLLAEVDRLNAAATSALSCLEGPTRTDSARMAAARELLRRAISGVRYA